MARGEWKGRIANVLPALGFGVAVVLAWYLSGQKPDAVGGRLNYAQFLVFALLVLGLVITIMIASIPPPKRRRAALRAGLVIPASLLALALVELGLFAMASRHPMDNPWYVFVRPDGVAEAEGLPFGRPPHIEWEGLSRGDIAILNGDADPSARRVVFRTDYQGFRNNRDIEQADIVFIGDSYTEAGNVPEEETYVQRVAGVLGVTSRNLGRAHYSPPVELEVLKRHGLACEPRAVVWQVAEGNDLIESLQYRLWLEQGKPSFVDFEAVNRSMRSSTWRRRSPTYRLYARLRHPRYWSYGGTFWDHTGETHAVRFLVRPGRDVVPGGHGGWTLMAEALKSGAGLLREQDTPLIVLLIPAKFRAMGPAVEFTPATRVWFPRAWLRADESDVARRLRALCGGMGVAFVDATSRLREEALAGNLVYLPMDTHLSSSGHEVVAGLLAEKVREVMAEEQVKELPE